MIHTPGPWRIEPVYIGPTRIHFGEYRFPREASTPFALALDFPSQHSRQYPDYEAEANACLIAAAPELLEALEATYDALSDIAERAPELGIQLGDDDFIAIDKARAAVAKARGE